MFQNHKTNCPTLGRPASQKTVDSCTGNIHRHFILNRKIKRENDITAPPVAKQTHYIESHKLAITDVVLKEHACRQHWQARQRGVLNKHEKMHQDRNRSRGLNWLLMRKFCKKGDIDPFLVRIGCDNWFA